MRFTLGGAASPLRKAELLHGLFEVEKDLSFAAEYATHFPEIREAILKATTALSEMSRAAEPPELSKEGGPSPEVLAHLEEMRSWRVREAESPPRPRRRRPAAV